MTTDYLKTLCFIGFFMMIFQGFSQTPLLNSKYGKQITSYLKQEKSNEENVDFDDLYVDSEYYSKKTKITHIYVGQRFKGVKIFNAISSVAIKNGEIFHFSNTFIKDINKKVNTLSPTISAQRAVQNVAKKFELGTIENLETKRSSGNHTIFSKSTISQKEIPVNLVYTLMKDGSLQLAWDVSIYTIDSKHNWSTRIDAITGEVLDYNDLVLHCDFGAPDRIKRTINKAATTSKNTAFNLFKSTNATPNMFVDGSTYNVFPLPVESPNHGARQVVSEPANLVASLFGWHDTNGIAGAEYTITRGNNVYAQEDADGNNGFGAAPDGGATLSFDYSFNPANQPAVYQDAAITNLFYLNNMMHDIWYLYGFDEAAGNFQQNNYGNGGADGDYVIADAQDGLDTNNANFASFTDGTNGRMQMFLWTGSGSSNVTVSINSPGTIAGDYTAIAASFGSSTYTITGDLVIVDDGSANPNEGCNTLTNAAAINGNIAVIYRGTCEFGLKALNAQNAGAIAVIVINNAPGSPTAMGPGVDGAGVTIPAIMISQADGATITNELPGVNATFSNPIASVPIDGDFDNGIVAHEYGHGISTRITGGPSASCLQNEEQMGEGWSDWFGLMITIQPGDLSTNSRGMGTFAAGQATSGGGIRSFPYSTDIGINPFTYDDIKTESIPHGVGSVWATMLWDLNWAFIDEYGFDADLYTGTGGNNMMMQLVIDGLKLQGCNPGFIDGRDAILAADVVNYNGANECIIWEVFAARGLGYSADQGSSNSRADGTEAFDLPPSVAGSEFTNATAITGVTEGETITFTVEATTNCQDVTDLTITDEFGNNTLDYVANSASDGGTFSGSTVTYPSIPTVTAGTNISYTYEATVKTGSYYAPVTHLDDTFDSGTNWAATGAGTADWTIASSTSCGSSSYFINNAGTESERYLTTTTPYLISGRATITIDHYYDTEATWDGGVIEFSIDGGITWSDLGPYMTQNGYNSKIAGGAGTVIAGKDAFTGSSSTCITTTASICGLTAENIQLRFVFAEDTNTSEDGWYIDAITILDEAVVYTKGKVVSSGVETTEDFCLLINPVLSVEEVDTFQELSATPNPTEGVLLIQNKTSLRDAKISVYDIMGRTLSNGINRQTINDFKVSIDISRLTAGPYFLTIENGANKHTKRIIKK